MVCVKVQNIRYTLALLKVSKIFLLLYIFLFWLSSEFGVFSGTWDSIWSPYIYIIM